jgi:hypothetical protein
LTAALVPVPTLLLCSVCVAWLGSSSLACFAWLMSGGRVGIGALLGICWLRNSAAKDGEGTAVLALLGLHRDWADDPLACAVLSLLRKKVGRGQQCSFCSAHIAGGPGQSKGGGGEWCLLGCLIGLHSLTLAQCWG